MVGEVVVDGAGRITPRDALAIEKDVVCPVPSRRVALGDGIPAKIHIFRADAQSILPLALPFRLRKTA
jgi:hypothetical protein